MLTGTAAQCNVACSHQPITAAASGDGCCPSGANANTDSDCKPSCGNGVTEHGELCDGSNCPTSCGTGSGCMGKVLMGSAAQCNAVCMAETITTAKDGDGCCPAGANANTDSDCTPVCGNGVVERGETCDTKLQNTFQCSPDCVARAIYTVCDVGQSSTCATNVQCDQGVCAPLAPNYTKNACPVPEGYSASQIGIYYGQYCAISCSTAADCPPQLTVCMDNPFLAADAREVMKYCTTPK
jgi:hypothetical protein